MNDTTLTNGETTMNDITLTRNTNSIFETKEEYVAFRAKWKQLHADGFHKPKKIEYGSGNLVKNPETGRYDYAGTSFFMVSPLTVWHHLVFNLAIGRNPPTKAFRVLPTDRNPWANAELLHALHYTHGAKHDFEPFGDTLTEEHKTKLLQLVKDFKATL